MKKHFIFLIGVLFNLGLCFSVEFKEISLSKAIDQTEFKSQKDRIMSDVQLQTEYESNNKLYKEYFKSVSGNFQACPAIGKLTGRGHVWEERVKYVVVIQGPDYFINLYDAYIDNDGIHGFAKMIINMDEKTYLDYALKKPYFSLEFADFCIHKDGSIESGYSYDDGSSYFNKSEYARLYLEKVYLKNDSKGYLICAENAFRDEYDFGKVQYGKYVFAKDGTLISCDPYTAEQKVIFEKYGAEAVLAFTKWDGKNFYEEYKTFSIPSVDAEFNGNDYSLTFTKERMSDNIVIKPKNKKARFHMKNAELSADSVTVVIQRYSGYDKMYFKNAVVYWGNYSKKFGDIEANNFEFAVYKEDCNDRIKIFADDDVATGYKFDSKHGLKINFKSRFPDQKKQTYYEVFVGENGKYWWYSYADGVTYDHHVEYTFDQTRIEGVLSDIRDGSLILRDSKIIFPENSCLAGLEFDDPSILPDGSISTRFRNGSINLFDIGSIICNSFKFTKDGILVNGLFYGAVIVDLEQMLSHSFAVERLLIGYDGIIKDLVLKPGSYLMRFNDNGWYLSGEKISVKINQTKDKNGKLLPPEMIFCFDDVRFIPPRDASVKNEFVVNNLKYRIHNDSAEFVFDDVKLPAGVNLDLKELFARKTYRFTGSLHASFREIGEINSALTTETVDTMRKGLFQAAARYEYDQNGKLVRSSGQTETAQKQEESTGVLFKYDKKGNLIEEYEYSEGLLSKKIVYQSNNRVTLYFYTYNQSNKPVKISVEYGLMDKWKHYKSAGISSPILFSYNSNGDVTAEKSSSLKYYEYEYYPDGVMKSKTVYIYNYPTSDL